MQWEQKSILMRHFVHQNFYKGAEKMKKIISVISALTLIGSLVFAASSFARASDEITVDGWEIEASSEIMSVKNAIDGNIDTIWHSSYTAEGTNIAGKDPLPFIIELRLPKITEISGFRYYPRLGGAISGTFYDVEVYISENGTDYTDLGQVKFRYNSAYSDRQGGKTVNFTGNVKIKALKLEVLSAYDNFGTMAELALLTPKSGTAQGIKAIKLKDTLIPATIDGNATESIAKQVGSPAVEPTGKGPEKAAKEEKNREEEKTAEEITDMTGWTVTASSGPSSAQNIVDGDINTIWHSGYKTEDGKITEKDAYPHIITLTLPKETTVSGFRYYPRLGGAVSGTVNLMGVEISSDGTNFTSLGDVSYKYNGAYTDREGGRATVFDSNVTIKALRLSIKKGFDGFGTMAELHLLKENSELKKASVSEVKLKVQENAKEEKPPEKEDEKQQIADGYDGDEYEPDGWTASASSTKTKAEYAIDGKMATYWHSDYVVENGAIVSHDVNPFDFVIDFGKETEISGIRYYPRPKGQAVSGIFYLATVSVSDDGKNFVSAVEDYTLYYGSNSGAGERTPCQILFPKNIKAKAVKITIIHSAENFAVANEIRVLKPNTEIGTITVSELQKNPGEYKLLPIDRSEFKVKVSSEQPYPFDDPNRAVLDLVARKLIDDSPYSLWHTKYRNEDGSTGGFNEKVMPATIEVDMGTVASVSALGYMPRGAGALSGHWVAFDLWSSVDGENYDLAYTFTLSESQSKSFCYMMFNFPEKIKARYFQIEIYKTLDDSGIITSKHASAGDIKFYETEIDSQIRLAKEKEAFVLKIGSKDINIINGEDTKVETIDVAPFIVDGTTMIPLRGLFEEMGADVIWHGENEKIDIDDGKTKIEFQIENIRVFVNSQRYTTIVAPRIVDSRTFIPLRFVSERLGYKVSWDGENQTITIEK